MAGKTNRRRRSNIYAMCLYGMLRLYTVLARRKEMRYTGLSLAFSQKERNKHETQNIRIMTPNKADREVQKRKKNHQNRGTGMDIPSSRNAGLVIYIISREDRNEIEFEACTPYRIVHFLFLCFAAGRGLRTARIASSNTLLRLRCVSAEHSKYL